MLRTQGLGHCYPNGKELMFPDLLINQGEEVLIAGPSGCGKTTLLHLLGGLLRLSKGEAWLGEYALKGRKEGELLQYRRSHIGLVFQTPRFLRSLTVRENLSLVRDLSSQKKSGVQSLLEELNIESIADQLPEQCSLGEQQRLSIACALVNAPSLILADEPTSALDDENCQKALHLLRSVSQKRNSILLVVTHDNRLKDQFSKIVEL
jgi:ABC-type lipoprotein export system ATPase subunit